MFPRVDPRTRGNIPSPPAHPHCMFSHRDDHVGHAHGPIHPRAHSILGRMHPRPFRALSCPRPDLSTDRCTLYHLLSILFPFIHCSPIPSSVPQFPLFIHSGTTLFTYFRYIRICIYTPALVAILILSFSDPLLGMLTYCLMCNMIDFGSPASLITSVRSCPYNRKESSPRTDLGPIRAP
jgi:hypothetical protein